MSIVTNAPSVIPKLRRSAMSIAPNAPLAIPKLRRSGMFIRRFVQNSNIRGMRIGTMNPLEFRIPKGFRLKAQGCRVLASPARTEATLGLGSRCSQPQRGCAKLATVGSWSSNVPKTLIGTMNQRGAVFSLSSTGGEGSGRGGRLCVAATRFMETGLYLDF
jgi:hypothetical protein